MRMVVVLLTVLDLFGLSAGSVLAGPAPPPNDACTAPTALGGLPASVMGSTSMATFDPAATFCVTSATAPNVWYTVVGTGNTITATTCNPGTSYDTKLSVYCADCPALTCVTGNDDDFGGSPFLCSTVSWCSVSGAIYRILVHGFGASTGSFDLSVMDDGVACMPSVSCPVPPTCNGLPATIFGTPGDDNLVGTSGDDVIAGLGGNDTICGNAGDDQIVGGDGDDTLLGGQGDDNLQGGEDNDLLIGATGEDILNGNEGDDDLRGGQDNDQLRGGPTGEDTLRGNAGDDLLIGGTENDLLIGGAGADTLQGNDGDDVLRGIGEDDLMLGGAGNDMLFGGDGEDSIRGNEGDDMLFGGDDDDDLRGGPDTDTCNGQGGTGDTAIQCETVMGVPLDDRRSPRRL